MTEDAHSLLHQAVAKHQAGDLAAAVTIYLDALETDRAGDADVEYLLATALLQLGRFDESIELFEGLVAARPDLADACNNLGVAYKAVGRLEQAASAFERAIQAKPDYDQAYFNLAALLEDQRLFAEAEQIFRRAAQLKPNDAEILGRLANVLAAQKHWDQAEAVYEQLALANPSDLNTQANLGFVLARQEKLDRAAEVYRAILAAKPDFCEIHNSLSYIDERRGRLDEAVVFAQRALAIRPEFAEAHNNLGIAFRSQHKLDDATKEFARALELKPDFALAEFNLATTRLLAGDYHAGWPGYLRYADLLPSPRRDFAKPRWTGEAIPGQRLLIYGDQGFGDSLQFARFVKFAKDRSGADVVLECQPELTRLFATVRGADRVVADNDPSPPFDCRISLTELAVLCNPSIDALLADVPYVRAPAPPSIQLGELLNSALPGELKIGLVWRGNPQQARDNVRSFRLETLSPLLQVRGARFFSLQKGREIEQHDADCSALVDLAPHLTDFADTAAVIEQLDLVITVDTSVAHLAGALGRPVWTLLGHTPDWRWHLERSDSPWYPAMTLFRQSTWGDWPGVVDRVASELHRLTASRLRAD